jgi:hypothetical protein
MIGTICFILSVYFFFKWVFPSKKKDDDNTIHFSGEFRIEHRDYPDTTQTPKKKTAR